MVLTQVPDSLRDAKAYTVEIGRLLGAHVELPDLKGLETIDRNHLTWPSAQRWSRTFMREIDALIMRCVSPNPAP